MRERLKVEDVEAMKLRIVEFYEGSGLATVRAARAFLDIPAHRANLERKIFIRAHREMVESRVLETCAKVVEPPSRRSTWQYRLFDELE